MTASPGAVIRRIKERMGAAVYRQLQIGKKNLEE